MITTFYSLQILANGINIKSNITKVSAYVQQNEMFVVELTVKEHLTFMVRFFWRGFLSNKIIGKQVCFIPLK